MKNRPNQKGIISRMGGKARLVDNIVPIIESCQYDYKLDKYKEVCGGGGRMLLNLDYMLFEKMVYNDLDEGICAIFRCLKDKEKTYALMSNVERYRYSREVFENAIKKRKDHEANKNLNDVELATYTYIANHQSRAANMTSYDKSKEGSKGYYEGISNLRNYYHILENVDILNMDCREILKNDINSEKTLIYIDPPYVPDTMSNPKTYGEFSWTEKEHEDLVDILIETKAKIILSGYKNHIYDRLVGFGWKEIFLKNVHVSSSGRGKRKDEYIWVNFEIPSYILDKVSSPVLHFSS